MKLSALNIETVVNAADAIVAEVGDEYRYEFLDGTTACKYVLNDQPACLVARILHRIGMPIEQLQYWDADRMPAFKMNSHAKAITNPDVFAFLASAQDEQDDGETWADAIKVAKGRLPK